MMTKFTIHIYSVSVVLFSKTRLFYFARLRSRQIIVLVSVLPEFAEQSRFLCRVSVDFGSRLLSKVPHSKWIRNTCTHYTFNYVYNNLPGLLLINIILNLLWFCYFKIHCENRNDQRECATMLLNVFETSKDSADFVIDRDVNFKWIHYYNVSFWHLQC